MREMVAGRKHGIKREYFNIRTTTCLKLDENKSIIKKSEPL